MAQVYEMASSVHDPKYRIFCRLIVDYRQRQGMTQTQLAEKLQRPQSFISKYENGERRIDLIEFIEIANALGIDSLKFIREFQEIIAETST